MMSPVLIKDYYTPGFNSAEALSFFAGGGDTERIRALLQGCYEKVADKLIYRVCYTEYEIKTDGDEIDLGFMRLRSEALAKYLKGCFGILLFAATVGVEMDRKIGKYAYSSPTMSFAFDAVGSERVETLCNLFSADMELEHDRFGMGLKNRFSPGYADFPLEAQREIFTALDPTSRIGVTLNDNLLMIPSKSVTAIIGMYRK